MCKPTVDYLGKSIAEITIDPTPSQPTSRTPSQPSAQLDQTAAPATIRAIEEVSNRLSVCSTNAWHIDNKTEWIELAIDVTRIALQLSQMEPCDLSTDFDFLLEKLGDAKYDVLRQMNRNRVRQQNRRAKWGKGREEYEDEIVGDERHEEAGEEIGKGDGTASTDYAGYSADAHELSRPDDDVKNKGEAKRAVAGLEG